MSNVGKILAMAGMLASLSERSQYSDIKDTMRSSSPDPEWKRKKCKSCKS